MIGESTIHSVEISTIAHATEDQSKVEAVLRKLMADSNQPFTRRYLEGHHRNPIITFNAKLTDRVAAQFARNFVKQLSRNSRLRIQRNLALHSDDKGNLYIRVDKQKPVKGEVELGEDDPIRIKIKFNRLTGDLDQMINAFLESE
jgi:RNA binding exosome subunit